MTVEERLREIMNSIDLAVSEPGAEKNPFLEFIYDDLAEIVCDLERERLGVVKAS